MYQHPPSPEEGRAIHDEAARQAPRGGLAADARNIAHYLRAGLAKLARLLRGRRS